MGLIILTLLGLKYLPGWVKLVWLFHAYLPYGELLVDEHSSSEEMPYKFNGKQFDEETGLYYYGARYMNPVASIWYGVDPLAEKYKSIGAYVYCSANPIRLIDSDGKKILFVNGYWNSFIGGLIGSSSAGANYWGDGFTVAAKSFFKDYSPINSTNFIDGSSLWGGDMSGSDRYAAGYKFAKDNLNRLTSGMKKGESFKMVTHSEGSAYGAGVAQYLLDAGYKVTTILHLSSDEGDEFSTPKAPYTLQLSYEDDWVTKNKTIKNVDKVGKIKKGNLSWDTVHGATKNKNIFNAAKDLKKVTLQLNIGEIDGKLSSWYNQENTKRTNFYSVNGIILNNLDGTKKDKWKNIVLLLIELPIVCFLALFTLDGHSSLLAYKEHPWSIFLQRFIFAFIPILIVEFLIFSSVNLIFMLLSKEKIYKGAVTKSFFVKHILYLLLMVLMVLSMKLLILDYC